MVVLRHRSAAASQVLVEEGGVAKAAVRIERVVGHRAEARPAEAVVEPVGRALGDGVEDEERLPIRPRLLLERSMSARPTPCPRALRCTSSFATSARCCEFGGQAWTS